MSINALRVLESAALAFLESRKIPLMPFVVEFSDGTKLANYPTNITLDGVVYVGMKQTTDEFTLALSGLGENLDFEVSSATIDITSLNGWAQVEFFLDTWRGQQIRVTQLYFNGSVFARTGWETSYTCDAEQADANTVTILLASNDAANGTEGPRRTSQGAGCQAELSVVDSDGGGCTFVWVAGVHAVVLQTCSRSYYGTNGCKDHHPDIVDPVTGLDIPRVRPYNAFLGSVDHKLVRAD